MSAPPRLLAPIVLLVCVVSTPALAGPPKSFPKAAPQSGDTKGCPSVQVLSRRFSFQSDGNGGGYGYYPVKFDANRQPNVVNPTEASIQKLVNNELPGSRMDLDEQLRMAWGTRCAYPDLAYVKTGLDTLRQRYTEQTGVTSETAKRWHLLNVDTVAFDEQYRAVCNGQGWPYEDPESGFIGKATCGGYKNEWLADFAFTAIDHGETSAIYPAAVVGLCGEELQGDGMGDPAGSEYFLWRQCVDEAARVDRAALEARLAEKAPNDVAATSFLVWYEKGLGRIEKWRPKMEETEQTHPAARQAYEDASAKVAETWSPALQQWRGELDAVDAWLEAVGKNPRDTGTCEVDLAGKLQAYVDATGAAKGDTLLERLKDPVGYRFTEALTLCWHLKGDRDLAKLWRDILLSDGIRVEGEHQGMQTLLIRNAGYGQYKGEAVPLTAPGRRLVLAREDETWAQRTLGRAESADRLAQSNVYTAEKVAGVSINGEVATLTFPRRTGTFDRTVGCQNDYTKLLRIDQWGYLHYAQKGCKVETYTADITQAPSRVPAWQAKLVKAGDTVYLPRKTGEPVDVDLAWVKRGSDVIWAGGAKAP
ncbi:MAG: hypothetical protein ACK4YP_10010 [Myxococcota bacterium]